MSSDNRVFEIYLRLQDGEELTVAQLQQEYGKSRRTVYQDLQEIRETLAEVTHSGQELIETPDGKRKLSKSNTLDERHIYALSKILLESRAFNKAETCKILNDLFSVESHQTGKWLHHSILNEMENYQSITNQNNRLNLLYQLETAIQENKEIQFNYHAVDELGYLGPDKLDKTVKLIWVQISLTRLSSLTLLAFSLTTFTFIWRELSTTRISKPFMSKTSAS